MNEHLIDLTEPSFWLLLLFAIFVVSPLTNERLKIVLWSFINCLFIFNILSWFGFVLIAATIIIYLVLMMINGEKKTFGMIILSIILFSLFLIHKIANFDWGFEQLDSLKKSLSVLGFSYLMLRVIEVARAVFEKRHPLPSFISMFNFLVPFHMLAAGPIQAYDDYVRKPVFISRVNLNTIIQSIERIVFGLFKKFVLAYLIQDMFLTDFESTGIYFFLEVQFFLLWLYLDFSAYSDIAVGVGKLLGIPTPENFNRPYLARNPIEFWERWHISLSLFIRRNVFIPIQLHLSRKNRGKNPLLSASLAFSIAFLLCGLWHGLTLNFLLWGGAHALGLISANLYRSYLKKTLGSKGVKRYLENKFILYVARFITYEFVAFSLVLLFFP